MFNKIKKCPICKKAFLEVGFSKHVIQKGQREVYQIYKKFGHVNLKSKGKPHEDEVRKKTIKIKVVKF